MKSYKPSDIDQSLLLPPNLRDWLSEGHLALFVHDVVDTLDLSALHASYQRGSSRGQPPYDVAMMTRLLVYGYCVGVVSSRKLEKVCWEDVGFRVLASNLHPDHDTFANFRRRHLKALQDTFIQVLKLCQQAGLVKLGHVAIDGTKRKAHENSRSRRGQTGPESSEEVH